MATLAPRWRFRLLDGQSAALDPRVTLRPKGGLPLQLEKRRDNSP